MPRSRQASSNWAMNSEPPSTLRLRSGQALDRFHREGHAVEDRIQEAGRGVSRGTAMYLQDLPAREDVAGGEVLEGEAREERNVRRIHLDDGAWVVWQVLFGLPDAMPTLKRAPWVPGVGSRSLHQPAAFLEP